MTGPFENLSETAGAMDNIIEGISAQVLKLKQGLVDLRHKTPIHNVEDYTLKSSDGKDSKLSELFGDKQDLIVIHNMGKGCNYCTMWADGFNGVLPHLEDRAAVALVSPDSPEVLEEFATSRGWRFALYSGEGSTFIKDMGFQDGEGQCKPGVSTFRRLDDGSIERVAKAPFGPGDDFCGVWHLFDLLSGGAQGWEPKVSYD